MSLRSSSRTPPGLTDPAVVALAAGAAAGAWCAAPVPVGAGVALVGLALLLRRPVALVVGTALLASGLAARAEAGLLVPVPAPFDGMVTLVGDPTSASGGLRAVVRVEGRRLELQARGQEAATLADRLAGERVQVRGRVGPVPEAARERLARRHVAGRLTVDAVGLSEPGGPLQRLANGLRRTLVTGAEPLGERRPLFTGMVIGDDRDQPVVVADDFEGAGLTHLLAVSGQNVAFVLVLAGPLLKRLGLGSRWAATLAVIGFFALVTRFEPSVLRASAMAAIACTAGGLGRPVSRIRILALAATAVLLVDPLLVRSVGFLLSVGASAGIILLARPVAERVPGPRWLAEVVGVTAAAQVGVAPVLLPVFGGVPLASLPANVLAVPAAGPLMVWGLTGGVAAGILGPPFDRWLHLPSAWLVGWIAAVARWGAALPLGTLRAGQALALVAIGCMGVLLGRHRSRRVLPGVAVATVLVLLVPLVRAPADLAGADAGAGARVWRAGGAVVVLLDDPWVPGLLEQLRDTRVRRVDVLVVRRGGRAAAGAVLELRSRVPVRLVLAPEGHRVRGAVVPDVGVVRAGPLVVAVTDTAPTLEVELRAAADGGGRTRP